MSYTPAQMQCLTAHRADYLKREIIKELHEPCAVKVACTVLEGESGGNPTDLLGISNNTFKVTNCDLKKIEIWQTT